MTKATVQDLTNKILRSRKYHSLYRPTVERIVAATLSETPSQKLSRKEIEKVVRQKLHQIWDAYSTRPNYRKLIDQVQMRLRNCQDLKPALLPVLRLQKSTKERIPILDNFYPKIFNFTGQPKTVIELACGLNALTYFWMPPSVNYLGFDVDQEQIDFINTIFKLAKVQNHAQVQLGDIFGQTFEKADVILLLKVLPLLERQQKGCSLEILQKMDCQYLVVSYPTRTLSGKKKGMADFYTKEFAQISKGQNWSIKKITFNNELVFVIEKL